MTLSVGGFGGSCITTDGWGCELLAVEKRRIREVLRPGSSIERILKVDSVLKR